MDQALRVIAVFLEVMVITGLVYCALSAVRLALFDFGINIKFNKPVAMLLAAAGILLVVFFVNHLTVFYPTEF
jgi:hypothetical protein